MARRPYRSGLRAEQARQTRQRVVAAAAGLFASVGYQTTTLAAIAREAGVSTETVKSQGAKAGLLLAAFETTFSGSEGEASLADTEVGAGILDLPGEQFLATLVDVLATANERGHALWTVVQAAALSDPFVRDASERMLASRRRDYERLVEELRRRGLAPEASGDLAAELSFLASPEGWQQLVVQSGWTRAAYVAWLTEALTGAVGARRPGRAG